MEYSAAMRPSKNVHLMEALAAEIKARRLKLDMSQEDLAGRCDIDRPYISLIEVAQKQPSLSVLWRLAGGLDWRLSDLMLHVEQRYDLEQRVRRRAAKADPDPRELVARQTKAKRRS